MTGTVVDIFAYQHRPVTIVNHPDGVFTRSERPGESRILAVAPGRPYRVCGSVDVLIDGVALAAKTVAVAWFGGPRARLRFSARGVFSATPCRFPQEGGASA